MAVLGSTGIGNGQMFMHIDHDPETVSTNAKKGSFLLFGTALYCKADDGDTTNVMLLGAVDLRAGETGGTLLNLVPFVVDPTTIDNDLFVREDDGTVDLVFYDGTNKRVLASEQAASVMHIHASSYGAADAITSGTPENLLKGCTLADAGELGSHWTVENAASDTLELKYAGKLTKKFLVSAQVNFTSNGDGNVHSLWLYKGGTKQANSLHVAECVTGADGVTMQVQFIIELVQNDTLRLMIDTNANTPVVTPRSLAFTATPI